MTFHYIQDKSNFSQAVGFFLLKKKWHIRRTKKTLRKESNNTRNNLTVQNYTNIN